MDGWVHAQKPGLTGVGSCSDGGGEALHTSGIIHAPVSLSCSVESGVLCSIWSASARP